MQNKVEYVREHYNKGVRRSILESVNAVKSGDEKRVKGFKIKRKKQRVWTLNRSPHGNKTAREQFGRQVWQRRRERGWKENGSQPLDRRKQRMYSQNQYVSLKEIRKEVCRKGE
jgi:hypothetical protein